LQIIAYTADRSYGSFDDIDDIDSLDGPEHLSTRTMAAFDHTYQGTDAEVAPLASHHDCSPNDLEYTDPYDPYDPSHRQKTSEITLYSEIADGSKC
jgi:L-serine deaminase